MAGTFGKIVKGTVIFLVVGAAVTAGALGIWDWRKTARSLKTVGGNVAHKVGDMEVTVGKPQGNAADAETCRANLRRIDGGKRLLADRAGGIAFKDVTWDAVLGAMKAQSKPKCPCGGTYDLGTMQELPRCSVGANNSRETKMHHMIR